MARGLSEVTSKSEAAVGPAAPLLGIAWLVGQLVPGCTEAAVAEVWREEG